MPDIAPDTSSDLSGLLSAASPPASLTKDLTSLARDKLRDDTRAERDLEADQSKYMARETAAMDKAGHALDDVKPWNADAESAKYDHSPIEAFGSFASVAGLLASAFTSQPLVNGLTASGAAMQAIRDGDAEAYKRAHVAYEENTKLALERQKVQHQAYEDLDKLRTTNYQLWQQRMRATAARFGDQKTLLLLENGMDPELDKLMDDRQSRMLKIAETMPKIAHENAQVNAYQQLQAARKSGDPDALEAAKANLRDVQDSFSTYRTANSGGNVKNIVLGGLYQKLEEARKTNDPNAIQAVMQEINDANEVFNAPKPGAAPSIPKEEGIMVEELVKQGVPREEAIKRAKDAGAPPVTGNRKLTEDAHIQGYDSSIKTIDTVLAKLDKYSLSAGAAGKATRLGERLSNVVGGNETDRVQMMRDIEYLQLVAPQLLMDRATGRPLSAEAGKISDIIAGLNMGDTVANTKRALEEVKQRYTEMRANAQSRLGGSVPKGSEGKPVTDPGWDDFPVKP